MAARPRVSGDEAESPVAQIKEQVPDFIEKENYYLLVDSARKLGEHLARKSRMTASQIRNIFGEVRRIEMLWEERPEPAANRLVMLRPKLAYQAKRFESRNRDPVGPLQEVIDKCIEAVGADRSRFRRLVDFFEAVLAYHKFYGGED